MNTKERTRFIFAILIMVLALMILMRFGPIQAELLVAGGLMIIYFALNAYYAWQEQSDREMKGSILLAFVVAIVMIIYFS